MGLDSLEIHILKTIRYEFNPTQTPAAFIDSILSQIFMETHDKVRITDHANALVGEFWESEASRYFNPSTIAISALNRSFVKFGFNNFDWLQSLPTEYCVNTSIDECIQSFKTLADEEPSKKHKIDQIMRSSPHSNNSISAFSKTNANTLASMTKKSLSPNDVSSIHKTLNWEKVDLLTAEFDR